MSTWLTTTEAAERLGVTTAGIIRWFREGRLAGYQMGRVIRIRRDAVEALVAGRAVRPVDGRTGRPVGPVQAPDAANTPIRTGRRGRPALPLLMEAR